MPQFTQNIFLMTSRVPSCTHSFFLVLLHDPDHEEVDETIAVACPARGCCRLHPGREGIPGPETEELQQVFRITQTAGVQGGQPEEHYVPCRGHRNGATGSFSSVGGDSNIIKFFFVKFSLKDLKI